MPQKDYWENLKMTDHKYQFSILKTIVFLTHVGYLVKLLNNH